MTDSPRGMPLLSGPPPELMLDDRAEMSCRKCNKEFNLLFARGRRCNHCGYSYCHSCSDYQALMPRRGSETGYDCMPVCAFCIQYLQITAGGKSFLRSQPLAKLKNYMQAYGLRLDAGVIEKDDIINTIIAARTGSGCLPRSNESYYRKHTVPNGQTSRPRGIFSRPERIQPPQQNLDPRTGWSRTSNFARPDLQPDRPQEGQPEATQQWNAHQQQQQQRHNARNQSAPRGPSSYGPYNSTPQSSTSTSNSAGIHPQPPPQRDSNVPPRPPRANNTPWNQPASTFGRNTNPGPNARPTAVSSNAPPSQTRPPRSHTPTLDELLAMQEEEVAVLSIGILKDVLDDNHVRPGLVLEKSELVARVNALITAERRERTRMEVVREREAWEAQEREWVARERERAAREAREREARETAVEEEEEQRRKEAYRTTVESASESEGDESAQGHTPPTEPAQTRSNSPSPSPDAREREDALPTEQSRSPSPPPPLRPAPERSGLCVVCQDEDANIVIVDCGHLALCRACSDLVWSSTRECPLCRTRIVTQARLLRVFKT